MALRAVTKGWPWPPPGPITVDLSEYNIDNAVDSVYITETYMERPVRLIAVDLGAWFNTAMGVKDETLARLHGQAAKKHIINAGYNNLPGMMVRLKHFNTTNED